VKNYWRAIRDHPPSQRVVRELQPARIRCKLRRPAGKTLGLILVDQTLAPTRGSPMYTVGSGVQDGVNLGTADPSDPARDRSVRRRRTWTHSPIGVRSKGAHAVEFSKTVAPLRKGSPSRGRARKPAGSRGGPSSIAPGWPGWKDFPGPGICSGSDRGPRRIRSRRGSKAGRVAGGSPGRPSTRAAFAANRRTWGI
jgi:hypothetical protein